MDGIIPIYKEDNWTSHDVVAKVRCLLRQKKVGHTGTLDPAAEGVLLICMGQATRAVEYIQGQPKRYIGSMCLGIATDTDDQTGQIVARDEKVLLPSETELAAILPQFRGRIEQVPPMYSALKIDGQRLYDLARQQKNVERKPRTVEIYDLKCAIRTTSDKDMGITIDFDVTCSKGTYIRTLCVDIGRALGYYAHMSKLIRIRNGFFNVEDCYTIDELSQLITAHEAKYVTSIDKALGHLPSVVMADTDAKLLEYGLSIEDAGELPTSNFRVYLESGEFVGIYTYCPKEKSLKPDKVFIK